jgi:hypothetical protein
MAPIFKPWIRGFALRLCGTLPIYRRSDDPALIHRNEDTFRACHEFLDSGGAVLIFPEGTSLTDRQIVQLKTGAARLALGQERRPGRHGCLTLLPVGLHFVERTRFRSDVAVSVGRPIELAPFVEAARTDEAEAVRQLTAHMQGVLEKLILNIPETDRVALVHGIERIYRSELGATPATVGVEVVRGMAECIEYFAERDPERIARAWHRVRRYQRHLEVLKIQDETLREMLPAGERLRQGVRLVGLGALGLLPALVGGLIHYIPYRLTGTVGALTRDPTRVAAYRIASAIVLYPACYLVLYLVLTRGLSWPVQSAAAALAVVALLGFHAMVYFNWLARQSQRIRLGLLKAANRRLVARLRRERLDIIEMCDRSRDDYLAAIRKPGIPA